MPRIWIDAAAVLLAATLLGGCATSKEKLLPHGDSTMLDIWHQETGGSAQTLLVLYYLQILLILQVLLLLVNINLHFLMLML